MTLSDPHLLALTIWLKSYQRLGYSPKPDEVPDVVVEHVRDALRLSVDVMAEVEATQSAKRHREFVRQRLGVKHNSAQAGQAATQAAIPSGEAGSRRTPASQRRRRGRRNGRTRTTSSTGEPVSQSARPGPVVLAD